MMERRLRRQLDEVAARYQRMRMASFLALVWIGVAAVGATLISLNRSVGFYFRGETVAFALLGAFATLLVLFMVWRAPRDPHWLAQQIESKYPKLDARLLTAIEQRPQLPDGRFGFLQQQVIHEAVHHGYRNDWRRTLPPGRYALAMVGCLAACLAAAVSTVGVFRYTEPQNFKLAPLLGFGRPSIVVEPTVLMNVDPGDAEVERGTSLLVLASFEGRLPSRCEIVLDGSSTDKARLPMSQSLDDPLFGGRVLSVVQDFDYQVSYDGQLSDPYHVTVFDYPMLTKADAQLEFPEFTNLAPTLVQDVRHVTAVEGTVLTLVCRFNKRLASAELVGEDGERLALEPVSNSEDLQQVTMTMQQSRRFTLELSDQAGRRNKQPPEFIVSVTPNQPPTVEVSFPSRDVQVSPIEELQLEAQLWDDFGISRHGVTFQFGDDPEQEIVLPATPVVKDKLPASYLLKFEELKAVPNQLLAYYFWAEDRVTDGTRRRTSSDMFFAEVRHFEEIFRQGQQPPDGAQQQSGQPGQGQQGGGKAEQLAEEQKQIVAATWNIMRRETEPSPSAEFADDVGVVRDSQSSLLTRVAELGQQIRDPEAQGHIRDVTQAMQDTLSELTRAIDESSLGGLEPAIQAERSAYQGLLRLRARENEVIRQDRQNAQQARGAGSGGSRSQQQLQQLSLSNDQNRYETERQAAEQQDQAQDEDRQVLNRLRELARRQDDLNKRLQELKSALEQAETESEKEELLKQLKRLRDQQQEILRDTDELNNRLNQNENAQEMQDAQRRLEQARENVRRSSEALEEGRLSQAINSGSRAERELEELREEFRKRASNRFAEDARELTRQAEELVDKQREISEALNPQEETDPAERKSLRQASPRQEVLENVEQQTRRLEDLLERMKESVRDAEETQPLFAEQLYESYRQALQDRLPETTQETQRSVRRGLEDDARQLDAAAREGLERLRDGIQRAAENVLSDETEALRRAKEEVDELAERLNREIQQSSSNANDSPKQSDDSPQQQNREGQRPGAQGGPENEASPNQQDEENEQAGQARRDARSQNKKASPEQDGSAEQEGSAEQGGGQGKQRSKEPTPGGADDRKGRPDGQGGRRQNGEGRPRGQQRAPSDGLRAAEPGASRRLRGGREDADAARGGSVGGNPPSTGPLTGDDFRDWSDRLREVEEMVSDPELKSDAARIRDRARQVRTDLKRHSKQPNWDLVRVDIAKPLAELRDRISEELLKRESKRALVPIDRDPVPAPYVEQVRHYYEQIGSGK
jgi:hypothetical protein